VLRSLNLDNGGVEQCSIHLNAHIHSRLEREKESRETIGLTIFCPFHELKEMEKRDSQVIRKVNRELLLHAKLLYLGLINVIYLKCTKSLYNVNKM